MNVSIIIINWNTRDILRNCLESVFKETQGIEFEVILVDNGSNDRSVQMVEGQFPEVNIIANKDNRGFAAANNQGMDIAKGRYILLLNSDTIILDNAIKKTVLFADDHTEAAVVGCRVLNKDKSLQNTCFMFPSVLNMFFECTYLCNLFPKSKLFGRAYMTWSDRKDVREVDVVAGCYMLVRKEAIQQVGMLDTRYFFYGEETDWCWRFKRAGWTTLYTPEPQIIHLGGKSSSQLTGNVMLQLIGSILTFMKLNRSTLTFTLSCLLTSAFFFIRVPYWLINAVMHKNNRKKSFATAMSYFRGGFYCLFDWKKLLINGKTITNKVSEEATLDSQIAS